MPVVRFDLAAQSVAVQMPGRDTVTMYPLQQVEVWGSLEYADAWFNPALESQPWYELLDPTRQHLPFSTQFGFEVVSGNVGELPEGAYVFIKALSISAGLRIYDIGYWADVWANGLGEPYWMQAFGEGNMGEAYGIDNIGAWGDRESIKMWHPVVVASGVGAFSATFEIYVGDASGGYLEGWSPASPFTLHWVAVPEPGVFALLPVVAAVAWLHRRRGRGV